MKYRLTTVLPFSLMRCSMISGGGAGEEICCLTALHCCCRGWMFSVSFLEAMGIADAGRELMARSRFIAPACSCNCLMGAGDSFLFSLFPAPPSVLVHTRNSVCTITAVVAAATTRAPATAAGASWSVFCRVITTSGHNDKITLSGAGFELHFSTKMRLEIGGQKWNVNGSRPSKP